MKHNNKTRHISHNNDKYETTCETMKQNYLKQIDNSIQNDLTEPMK
jgi:hypothetical protein